MTNTIQIPFQDKPFDAYSSTPDNVKKTAANPAGVIVIHEVWGLNAHTRDVANRIAALGYNVIAPDLLSHTGIIEKMGPDIIEEMANQETRDEAQKKMRAAMTPLQQPEFGTETVARLQACYDYLQNAHGATKIACVGFCFGGTYTFAFAVAQPELKAGVAFYGHAPENLDDIAKINAPILVFYGEQDPLVQGIPELEAAFQKYGKHFEHFVYPDTGHAFFNDTNTARYNKAAADDSWTKTVDFLQHNLA